MTELAEVLKQVNVYRTQQAEYRSESATLLQDQHNLLIHGKLDPIFQARANQYLSALRKRSDIAEKRIEDLKPELEKRQKALLDARKNRRVIEILKEKKIEEHKYHLNKNAIHELDEFNQKKLISLHNTGKEPAHDLHA